MKDVLVVRRPGVLMEAEVDDELVGLDVESGTCYGFNVTATRIWSLLTEPRPFSQLRDALIDEYDVDRAECEARLLQLLDEWREEGLVEMKPLP